VRWHIAVRSLGASVRSRANARVTHPQTSSKVAAAWVRSSTVSSTLVSGGLLYSSTISPARVQRCRLTPSITLIRRCQGTVT